MRTYQLAAFDDTLAVSRGRILEPEYIQASRRIVERVLVALEGRRVLFGSRSGEDEEHCRKSADDIRKLLDREIVAANAGPLQTSLRKLRSAAKLFVDHAGNNSMHYINDRNEFLAALAALRDAFGPEIGWMALSYRVAIEPQLIDLVPDPVF